MRSVTWTKGGFHPEPSTPQFNQSMDPLGPVVEVTCSVKGPGVEHKFCGRPRRGLTGGTVWTAPIVLNLHETARVRGGRVIGLIVGGLRIIGLRATGLTLRWLVILGLIILAVVGRLVDLGLLHQNMNMNIRGLQWVRTGRCLHRRVSFARREMPLWLERWTWLCRVAASAKTEIVARRARVGRNFMAVWRKKECRGRW